jgi:hypothetical protein
VQLRFDGLSKDREELAVEEVEGVDEREDAGDPIGALRPRSDIGRRVRV